MMDKAAKAISASLMIGSILVTAASAGARTVKYAGSVRTIDRARGALVLEDIGPWVAKGPETPITPRTIMVSPSTEYFVAERAKDGTTGFLGDYRETRAEPSALTAGVFIVVECEQAKGGCMASKVTVVRPTPP